MTLLRNIDRVWSHRFWYRYDDYVSRGFFQSMAPLWIAVLAGSLVYITQSWVFFGRLPNPFPVFMVTGLFLALVNVVMAILITALKSKYSKPWWVFKEKK